MQSGMHTANCLNKLRCRHLEHFEMSAGCAPRGVAGLSSFSTALCSLTNLTSLSFEGQQLGRLPREISQLGKLACLDIQ